MKITIVGVGALGSHLVQFLRNLDAEIKVIDFDRIEQKNVMSQFHAKNVVGKLKAQALQQSMSFLFGTKLTAIGNKLTSDNVRELLAGSDLVIDCLDNAESRRVIHKFVKAEDIPCLHGALAADGNFGVVAWDDFVIDDTVTGAATCEDGEHLPFIGLAATCLARAAQEFVASGARHGYRITPRGVIGT